jgi:hypothetical protein
LGQNRTIRSPIPSTSTWPAPTPTSRQTPSRPPEAPPKSYVRGTIEREDPLRIATRQWTEIEGNH